MTLQELWPSKNIGRQGGDEQGVQLIGVGHKINHAQPDATHATAASLIQRLRPADWSPEDVISSYFIHHSLLLGSMSSGSILPGAGIVMKEAAVA